MSTAAESTSRGAGHVAVALGVLLFSTIEVASKAAMPAIGPFQLAFLRFFIAGLVLLPFALWNLRVGGYRFKKQDLLVISGLALVGVTSLSTCFHLGVQWLPAHQAAILFSGHPVFVAIIAPALLGEKVTRRGWIAIGCGVAGVACLLVTGAGGREVCAEPNWMATATGAVFTLGAMFFFSLYSVLSKKVLPRFGAVAMTSLVSLVGCLGLLPWVLGEKSGWWKSVPPSAWGAVAWLALAATALAYVLYFAGLKRIPATRGAQWFFMKPLVAVLLAWGWLGEKPSWMTGLAAIFILSGTVVAIRIDEIRSATTPASSSTRG